MRVCHLKALVAVLFLVSSIAVFAQSATPVHMLVRVRPTPDDRMITISSEEATALTPEAQVYYLRTGMPEDGKELYRYYTGVESFEGTDDSLPSCVSEAPPCLVGPIGNAWTTRLPGMAEILLGSNRETGDHVLVSPLEPLPGYEVTGLGVYGYPRFSSIKTSSFSAGGVSIHWNPLAGGIIWRWEWNGMQFLNNFDFNRGIQSTFFFDDMAVQEGGDRFSTSDMNVALMHGAPLLRAHAAEKVFANRSHPLDAFPEQFSGEPNMIPVMYPDIVMGRDLQLDFANLGPVARNTTYLSLPQAKDWAWLVHSAVSLNTNFRRFYTYDATADVLSEVTDQIPAWEPQSYTFVPMYGGVIVSTDDGAYAFGLYGVHPNQGGTADGFEMRKYWPEGGQPNTLGYEMSWIFASKSGAFSAGENKATTYQITNTLEGVHNVMRRLYRMGVK